jgi:zinc protease
MEDIRSMAMEDVQRFYSTYYAPNNATLVVVGDVEEKGLLDMVERSYGAIAPAQLPADREVEEPPQRGERRRRFAKPTPAPRLLRGYRAVRQADPDYAALSFVASLLSSGPSSRLYRRLVVEREMALTADCDVAPLRDPGLFRISVQLTRDHQPEAAEAEVDAVLAELADRRIDDVEIEKVRSAVETDFWSDLEGVDGRAEALGHHQVTMGDFRRLFDVADALARVTPEDVQRAVRTYLVAERCCSIVIDPDGDEDDGDDEDDAGGPA